MNSKGDGRLRYIIRSLKEKQSVAAYREQLFFFWWIFTGSLYKGPLEKTGGCFIEK